MGTNQGSLRPFRLLKNTRNSEALEMGGMASSLKSRQERKRKRRAEIFMAMTHDPWKPEAKTKGAGSPNRGVKVHWSLVRTSPTTHIPPLTLQESASHRGIRAGQIIPKPPTGDQFISHSFSLSPAVPALSPMFLI